MSTQAKGNGRLRRNAAKWARRAVLALLGLGLVALVVMALLPKPVPVDLAEVTRGPLRVSVDEDGRTRVKDQFVISAPLTGSCDRITLEPGDIVEEGQVLARLVPLARPLMDQQSRVEAEARVAAAQAQGRQARAAIQRARAAVEFQDNEVARQQRLHDQGTVPPQTLERALLAQRSNREELTSAEFGARVAAHQLELARAALGRYRTNGRADDVQEQFEVRSPVAGQVLRVTQESAGVVSAGTPLLVIGDPSHLEIAVDVLTSDAVEIEPGARVVIERWGGPADLEGHVRLVEPSAFTRISALGVEEQRVNVVIDLDSPREEWSRLGDGFRVETRIIVWEEPDVLQVPSSAVFRRGDGWAAFRVGAGEKVEVAAIESGVRNGLAVQVREGLSEADRVVVHPSDRVVDGVRVAER